MTAQKEYYQKSITEIFSELKTNKEGLSTHQAGRLLNTFGYNLLPTQKPPSAFSILFSQFKNPLILILVISALITLYLRDFIDSVVISFAIFINTILGFLQEYKAQKDIYSLKKLFMQKARVLRSGKIIEISAKYLVPGDIVLLQTGQKTPADIRIIKESYLKVNEAALTGESAPVQKTASTLNVKRILAERKNMLFWGTSIVGGSAKGVVVGTGLNTELGKIAQSIRETKKEPTPLQKSLASLSKTLAIAVIGITTLVFVIGFFSNIPALDMFTTSVALAVAAIPEGLAVSLTVVLAIGMQRIFKKKALVRELLSAETLGSVTAICVDKTGTLTEGNMKVVTWKLTDLSQTLKAAALCNDIQNQTEIALWEKIRSIDGFDPQKIRETYKRISVIPFGSERKYMAVLIKEDEDFLIYVKGAPEKIVSWSKLSFTEKTEWFDISNKWANKGLRVLALAYKNPSVKLKNGHISEKVSKELLHSNIESGLVFLGLIALADPVREGVKEALIECKNAGIKAIVITGDFRATAQAVMEELGIKVKSEEIMEGDELESIGEEELRKRILGIKLFARITPSDKLKIVLSLKSLGQVVAVTGDGTNDAPALKGADIGIVVSSATEVARENADMILLDNNFNTIVKAVEEGRAIFDNIRKVALYLLSDSLSAIFLIVGALMFKLPLPLTAAQILWINLITDGFPNLALTIDPKRPDLMKEPPRKPEEPLLDNERKFLIFFISSVTGFGTLATFATFIKMSNDLALSQTIAFAVLGMSSLIYVFSCRNLRVPLLKDKNVFSNKALVLAVAGGLFLQVIALYNPFLQKFLGLLPLNIYHWIIVILCSILVIILIEGIKTIFNRSKK
ncbi:MAG: HAD-IC family P-type ATPase [bacterium]